MSELSRELGVSLSAMTQIADRLERARLVQRITSGEDRRVKLLRLTERGEEIMRKRDVVHTQRVLDVLGKLTPGSREHILAALELFLTACNGTDGHGVATEAARSPST